jgi:hypothetical protein
MRRQGKWTARVDFSPKLPGGNKGGRIFKPAKGGYDTLEVAKAAALTWARGQIDLKASLRSVRRD